MNYLALTELDNENRSIAVVTFDQDVKGKIKRALTEHYDADIIDMICDDLQDCLHGKQRKVGFAIDGVDYSVQVEQTWLY